MSGKLTNGAMPESPDDFVKRLHMALDAEDPVALRAWEAHRIALVEAIEARSGTKTEAHHRSALEWSIQDFSAWGVGTALAWDLPRPDMGKAFQHFIYAHIAQPSGNEGHQALKQQADQIWEMLAPLVSAEQAIKVWGWMLDAWGWKDETHQQNMVAVLISAGADPLAALKASPLTCQDVVDREANVAPLFLAWANGAPLLAESLLDLGADAWNPLADTQPNQWTLARALGVDDHPWITSPREKQFERDCLEIHKDGSTSPASWARLAARVRQQRIERKLEGHTPIDQNFGQGKARPRI